MANQVVALVQNLRQKQLSKSPGVAETLDWGLSLLALGCNSLDLDTLSMTLGCVLKSTEDIELLKTVREHHCRDCSQDEESAKTFGSTTRNWSG